VILGLFALGLVLLFGLWGYARWANMVPSYIPPAAKRPIPNGYERAAAALSHLPPEDLKVASRWPIGPTEPLRKITTPARPVLDSVRAALRLEWQAPPPTGSFTPTHELSQFRSCTRLFVAEATIEQNQQRFGDALHRRLDAMELGSKVPRGGSLLHGLVGSAVHAMGFAGSESLVERLQASEVAPALSRVRRIRKTWPRYSESLEYERQEVLAVWAQAVKVYQPATPLDMLDFLWTQVQYAGSQSLSATRDEFRLWLTPKRAALDSIDRYYRQLMQEVEKPLSQRKTLTLPGDAVSRRSGIDPQTAWSGEVKWWVPRVQLALLEIALAIQIHHRQHGVYPARLSDVSRRWLPVIPSDPWGKPILYRRKAGRPLVYSAGPDGKDDGGQPAVIRQLNGTTTGDLVWGTFHPPRR
jgi:hypothetical protein